VSLLDFDWPRSFRNYTADQTIFVAEELLRFPLER
jgi:hypothetical protein